MYLLKERIIKLLFFFFGKLVSFIRPIVEVKILRTIVFRYYMDLTRIKLCTSV